MEINGYQAVIQYDPEIEIFRGEFIGLNGGADFYGRDSDTLRKEGEISLKVYLEMCQEDGIEHERSNPASSTFDYQPNYTTKPTEKEIYEKLHQIYEKHRKKYRRNFDSKQMCEMWSTYYPPDVIEGTKPFIDIENAFDIEISDEDCLEIYDMTIEEATVKIAAIIEHQLTLDGHSNTL